MPFFGYGYQVRIFPGERRMFVLDGIRGQRIFVDPASRLVMVHTAVRNQDRDPGDREESLWQSLVRGLGTEQRTDAVARPPAAQAGASGKMELILHQPNPKRVLPICRSTPQR